MKKAVLIPAISLSLLAATLALAAKYRAGRPSPVTASNTKETTSQPARAVTGTKSIAERREKMRQAAIQNTGNSALISTLLRCASCHDLKGRKDIIGPPLAGVAERLTREEVIEQLLQPDKRAAQRGIIMVTFSNGRSEEVRLIKDSGDTLQVRNGEGKIRAIPREEIEEYAPVGSQMPSGLVDGLTEKQFTDLVEFLMSCRRSKE